MMLPPVWPISCATLASTPGWSTMPILSRTMRPSRTKPRVSTQDKSRTSMLPPQMTTPTLRPAKRAFSFMSAATPMAPAPPATIFCSSTRM